MKVRVDKITSTPSGLVVGLQVRGPADSWLRFARLEIPWESLDRDWAADYGRWLDRERASVEVQQQEALSLDWS